MKTKYFIVILSIFSALLDELHSQCVVDAGENRNLCQEELANSPKLLGSIVSGDVIETRWETSHFEPWVNVTYYASSILSDTTILEPTIDGYVNRTQTFYLTGVTSSNQTCRDSVELNFSVWDWILGDKVSYKSPDDTINLWIGAVSNWPHKQYEWSPNYMISDTTVENPTVWNDTTTFYNLIITDSIGCQFIDDVFEVFVIPTSTSQVELNRIKVYPNPTNSMINIRSESEIRNIIVYDIQGRVVRESVKKQISIDDLPNGNYLIKVIFMDHSHIVKQIVKRITP